MLQIELGYKGNFLSNKKIYTPLHDQKFSNNFIRQLTVKKNHLFIHIFVLGGYSYWMLPNVYGTVIKKSERFECDILYRLD